MLKAESALACPLLRVFFDLTGLMALAAAISGIGLYNLYVVGLAQDGGWETHAAGHLLRLGHRICGLSNPSLCWIYALSACCPTLVGWRYLHWDC